MFGKLAIVGAVFAALLGCKGSEPSPEDVCPDPNDTTSPLFPACDEAAQTLAPGFESELTDFGVCGDALFFAANPDRTLVLGLSIGGLASDVEEQGVDVACEASLPHTIIPLTLRIGTALNTACEASTPERVELCTWVPTAGTVNLSFTVDESELVGDAELSDLKLQNANGDKVTLPYLDISGGF